MNFITSLKKVLFNKSVQTLKIDFDKEIQIKTCASKDKIKATKKDQVMTRVKTQC